MRAPAPGGRNSGGATWLTEGLECLLLTGPPEGAPFANCTESAQVLAPALPTRCPKPWTSPILAAASCRGKVHCVETGSHRGLTQTQVMRPLPRRGEAGPAQCGRGSGSSRSPSLSVGSTCQLLPCRWALPRRHLHSQGGGGVKGTTGCQGGKKNFLLLQSQPSQPS